MIRRVEFPAFVAHSGMPGRPTAVRRADADLAWRVVDVLAQERDVDHNGRAAHTVYRLRVFGPLPRRPHQDGEFVLVAANYHHAPYWWIAPA